MDYSQFWNNIDWSKAVPGMLGLGAGAYVMNQSQEDAKRRLANAQGPVYQTANANTQGLLTQAASNPDELAANRFAAQQALVKPLQDKQLTDLYSFLRAKGQLGIGNYQGAGVDPISGTTQTWAPGMLANPQLAAYYAAQAGQRSKDAYASLDQGQQYADALARRAATTQSIAANAQGTGIQAQNQIPSRPSQTAELLKGGLGVLKDSGILKEVPGMISGGIDWLKNWWSPPTMLGGYDTGTSWI